MRLQTMQLGVSGTRGQASRFDGLARVAPVDVAVATRPALVRDVLSRALGARLGLRVVAFGVGAGEDATQRLLELRPRILLIDDDDSVSDLEAVLRRLQKASPSTRILVLTTRSDEDALCRFVRAGAYGVVQNRSDLPTLVRAVEAASAGRACEAAETAKRRPVRPKVVGPDADNRLTTREWEVAGLVAKGLRNKGIALRLNISVDTVKSHLNNSFRKLELDGRLALGILARSRLGPTTDM
jgi:DNA-binding NarL/FixJ family response regulator